MSKNKPLNQKKQKIQAKRQKAKKGTLKELLLCLKPHKWFMVFSILFSIIYVAAALLAPVFVGKAIDCMVGVNSVNFEKVYYYVIMLIVTIAIAVFFQYLMNTLASIAAQKTVNDLRTSTFNKLNKVPLKTIDSSSQGDLIHRVINDTDRISEGMIQGFTNMFSGLVTVIGTIVLMFNINIYITIAVIVLTPMSIAVTFIIAKLSQRMFARQVKAEGDLTAFCEEYISGLRLVKLFNYRTTAENKFDVINQEIKYSGTKAVTYSAIINPATRLLNGFVYLAVCIFGASLIIKGNTGLSVGTLSIFLSYALQYAKPFNEISTIITEMQVALVSADRVFEILQKDNESDDYALPCLNFDPCLSNDNFNAENDLSLNQPAKANLELNSSVCKGDLALPQDGVNVCFKNVDFSYTDKPFITNFNLTALEGQHVAIVGKTGCGKTTILSLLMRFYDLNGGQISFKNQDISLVKRSSIRANVGMVLQDTWLFKGTYKQNIAYGKQDATLDEIMTAAKKARIHSFICNLKDGYDTVLEPNSLSQGQMQLLCIARVFLALPKIIILDEATSNIDARTEIQVQKAFKEITSGHTSFIVAHRLSTIKNADQIVVMDNGKIVEIGNHQTLLEKGGKFAQMIADLQNV